MFIWKTIIPAFISIILATSSQAFDEANSKMKTKSLFVNSAMRTKAIDNAAKYPWASVIQKQLIADAQPWVKLSDDELWNLMFGATIKRSWMVWSNGFCPSCKKAVTMYAWEVDPFKWPWKVQCPDCKELFPKNDFQQFYQSGLDEHGVFDSARADRTLLYNTEHPDPKDPLHMFGVDDGDGYAEGDNRWRFIGAYLIYGQWKKAIVSGVEKLAMAYSVTGDSIYSHKAGVLLDRIADLYPTFDFGAQGYVYEDPALAGYVSTWHDACWETMKLSISYDQVFDGIKEDKQLQYFLADKSKQYKLNNPKASFADIQRNIETGILKDALINRKKIQSNYPQTDLTQAYIKTILGWPGNKQEVMDALGSIISNSTSVDGLTGEKGLSGYSSLSPKSIAIMLGQYSRIDPHFLSEIIHKHPKIYDSYRFFIDTQCLGKYYPNIGDAGCFARPDAEYAGLLIQKMAADKVNVWGTAPSMYSFLWDLYQITKDQAFVQILYKANDYSLDGLPYDIYAENPADFPRSVKEVISHTGTKPALRSVNKTDWHLSLLRSGKSDNERVLWLDYDCGGKHSHSDGMNIGLFAKGLDLLPDFGYPPVQYGGWDSPRSKWYMTVPAHNTVVVDKSDSQASRSSSIISGKTTLWADGNVFKCIRVSGAEIAGIKQYERTAALIDISDNDSYVFDVFRVVGGMDHAKMLHGYFGKMSTSGVLLKASAPYFSTEQMRNFNIDPSPKAGWSVDWIVEDYYKLLPKGKNVCLRYTDLTKDAQAMTAESWIATGLEWEDVQSWVPCLGIIRHSDNAPLSSTFAGIIEPFEKSSKIRNITRLPLQSADGRSYPDSCPAVEIKLADGRRDIIISGDIENPLGLTPSIENNNPLLQKENRISLAGEMGFVRFDKSGNVQRLSLCNGTELEACNLKITTKKPVEYIEISINGNTPSVISGNKEDIAEITLNGRSIL